MFSSPKITLVLMKVFNVLWCLLLLKAVSVFLCCECVVSYVGNGTHGCACGGSCGRWAEIYTQPPPPLSTDTAAQSIVHHAFDLLCIAGNCFPTDWGSSGKISVVMQAFNKIRIKIWLDFKVTPLSELSTIFSIEKMPIGICNCLQNMNCC